MSDNPAVDSDGSDSDVFDGSFSVIGDFHYVLSADGFRDKLDSADVIFLEYPDAELDEMGLVKGLKTGYQMGGLLMMIAWGVLHIERQLFGRGSLISVLLSEYREKIVGVEGVDEREMYMQGRETTGFKSFVIMLVLFVLLPRRVLLWFIKMVARSSSDKDVDAELVVEDFEAIADEDGERGEGMDERDMAMVENVESHLAENPNVDDVVMVVGMAHLASIIRLLDGEGVVDVDSIEVLNSGIRSKYLIESGPYNFVEDSEWRSA